MDIENSIIAFAIVGYLVQALILFSVTIPYDATSVVDKTVSVKGINVDSSLLSQAASKLGGAKDLAGQSEFTPEAKNFVTSLYSFFFGVLDVIKKIPVIGSVVTVLEFLLTAFFIWGLLLNAMFGGIPQLTYLVTGLSLIIGFIQIYGVFLIGKKAISVAVLA
jgi:hypothetical protein